MTSLADRIELASQRLTPFLQPTPFRPSSWLSSRLEAEVFLKLECVQPTGSFKVRGAFSKLLATTAEMDGEPLRAVAASTGNHGCAVAYALSKLGGEGVVFVPEDAAANKVEIMKRLGVEVRAVAGDPLQAELAGRKFAVESDAVFVSPYNDLDVACGQGTIAVEMQRAVGDLDYVFGSLGGGGMLGGISTWFKSAAQERTATKVVACSPENSRVMMDSVRAGRILDQTSTPTLSDGTAGGVEEGAITFDLVRSGVDDYLALNEYEIGAALVAVLQEEGLLIEGAAAVSVAGVLKRKQQLRGKKVGIVLCGANIKLDVVRRLLDSPSEGS